MELIIRRFFLHFVCIPYGIGCGLGGGDWRVVSKMLQEVSVSAISMCSDNRDKKEGKFD